MLTVDAFKSLSESEIDISMDFLLKEGLEILTEEVDYYFSNKEQLVDFFIRDFNMNIKLPQLQEKFQQVFLSEKDLGVLLAKIEKRIQKEINRTVFSVQFKFSPLNTEENTDSEGFYIINQQLKTYKLSQSMTKLIDTAWKKTSPGLVPKQLRKQTGRFKAGNHFLSLLGVSSKEIKENVEVKLRRVLLGTLKQSKIEILQFLKKDIINKLNLVPQINENEEQFEQKTSQVQIA